MALSLLYFPLRGRGEVARLLFAEAGAEYTETAPENWPEVKKAGLESGDIPFGQLPQIKDGDLILVQSNTIARHLARKFNLYGANNADAAFVDMLNDTWEEVRDAYVKLIYVDKVSEDGAKAHIEAVKGKLALIEKVLTKANGGPYHLGDTVSFVDFNAFELIEIHSVLVPSFIDEFPRLKALHAAVGARPNIAAYVKDKRPSRINGNGLGEKAL